MAPGVFDGYVRIDDDAGDLYLEFSEGFLDWRLRYDASNMVLGASLGANDQFTFSVDGQLSTRGADPFLLLTRTGGTARTASLHVSNPSGDTVLSNSSGLLAVQAASSLILQAAVDVVAQPSSAETARFKGAGGLTFKEKASAPSTAAGEGSFWVQNTAPSSPRFTDDTSTARALVQSSSASTTDNRVARFDGTTGGTVQDTAVTIDDSGNLILENNGTFLRFGGSASNTYVTGSGAGGGDLTLRSNDDIFVNSADDTFIQSGGTTYAWFNGGVGSLGIGADATTYRFQVQESTPVDGLVYVNNTSTDSAAGAIRIRIADDPCGTGNRFIRFNDGPGSILGSITANSGGTGINYNTTSDARLKTDIVDAPEQIAAIKRVRVVQYAFKSRPGTVEIGVLAQELAEVCAEAVSSPEVLNARSVVQLERAKADGSVIPDQVVASEWELEALRRDAAVRVLEVSPLTEEHEEYSYWGVDYGKLTPRIIKAMQEQQALIEALQARAAEQEAINAALQGQVAQQHSLIAALTARLEALERR